MCSLRNVSDITAHNIVNLATKISLMPNSAVIVSVSILGFDVILMMLFARGGGRPTERHMFG